MKEKLMKEFEKIFGSTDGVRTYFAPGRVNMIGEHTDYNGGHVFPCALTIGTYLLAKKREDTKLRFYSMNFPDAGLMESSLEDLVWKKQAGWTNYPKGVMWAFREKGYQVDCGFDILLFGNIPNGSGLSSSASVELATGVMLRDMFGHQGLTMIDLSLIGQFAENNFNGVNCGIMDQFAIAMGKKDEAIFLDTSDLSYQYAPLKLQGARIVIACSNKKRGLGDSKYNERRAECEEALRELQTKLSINSLGELTEEEFEANKDLIADPVRRRRANLDRGLLQQKGGQPLVQAFPHGLLHQPHDVGKPAGHQLVGVVGHRGGLLHQALVDLCGDHPKFRVFLRRDRHLKLDGTHHAGGGKKAHIPVKQAVDGDLPALLRLDIGPELPPADEQQPGAIHIAVVQDLPLGHGAEQQAARKPLLLVLVQLAPNGKMILKCHTASLLAVCPV